MRKRKFCIGIAIIASIISSCGSDVLKEESVHNMETQKEAEKEYITMTDTIHELESGFSVVRLQGDYGFEDFLKQGGAKSDAEVLKYLTSALVGETDGLSFEGTAFGCSTISVQNKEGGYYFGRNFDWNTCDAMVVACYPENEYASISTVNMDFVRQGAGLASYFMGEETLKIASLYAPLDGMNEKGLCVSVNMIEDSDTISQNSDKTDITTTTAIRLLLNKAATVEEAVGLLKQYDFHASMNYMVHLAIADNTGKSVAIEYIDNQMQVIETPILTNYYLAKGEKNGIGTKQSHTRFDILKDALQENNVMDAEQVKDTLSSVSKKNFGEFESTEWSAVFDQTARTVTYYHRENYNKAFVFLL